MRSRGLLVVITVCAVTTGCGSDGSPTATDGSSVTTSPSGSAATTTSESDVVAGHFDIGGGHELYLSCIGSGAPTILLEAGDESGSEDWGEVRGALAADTRTCAYDRAGTGRSDDATGCRGLDDLLADLETLLAAAEISGPYVLVGASGGGYLMAGFAARHPDEVAGLVLVETPKAITILPPEIAAEISCDSSSNVEHRDYYAVEHDVWDHRAEIGDFPMTIISNEPGAAAVGDEVTNVADQRGWLVLSPRATQVVVTSGHDVPFNEPDLVIEEILAVLDAARQG